VKVFINSTILEVTRQVGLAIKTWAAQCKLTIDDGNIEIRANDNGKTVAEMRLKNGQALTVTKRANAPSIKKA
jgi:ferric-dicitrate binding protein FerR (iron transport regulator)